MRLLCILTILFSLVQPAGQPPTVSGQTTQQSEKITYIPLKQGGADSAELLEAVSGELHWAAGSYTAFTRTLGVSPTGSAHLPADSVSNLVARFPGVFSLRDDPSNNKPSLSVNKSELTRMLADKKSKLRKWLAKTQGVEIATLTKVAKTWSTENPTPPRILVVMAGLHGMESSAEAVASELHKRTNLPAYVFRYPNDAPVAESAGLLLQRLREEHRRYPQTKVTLIAHSLGGLVSRCAIETSPTNTELTNSGGRRSVVQQTGVDQLIQVCPPNHGSALAKYGPLLEGAEQVYRLVHRRAERRSRVLFRGIVDGFNEATTDLDPKSEFLSELNKRLRNPNVRYSILAGNDGPLRSRMTTLIGNVWERVAAAVDEPAELDVRIRAVLQCEELQKGKGDGVVTIESAKLGGVHDFQVLKMHHLVWSELDSEAGKLMLSEVASRLGISL